MSDNELALSAGRGNRQAFHTLLERHYGRIFRTAWHMLGDRQDAEDLAQDVCVALPAKLRRFEGRSAFTTWLYSVVANMARDQLRKKGRQSRLAADYIEVRELQEAGDQDTHAQLNWMQSALGSLDDMLQQTARLVLAEDMSHAEAGEVLGVKESTVSWRMHKIRQELKTMAEDFS